MNSRALSMSTHRSTVKSCVVVDGNYISTAGVTAGLDRALLVASLLRSAKFAKEIQLDIQYAPNPIFNSGTPEQAQNRVIDAFFTIHGASKQIREAEPCRFAAKLGIKIDAVDVEPWAARAAITAGQRCAQPLHIRHATRLDWISDRFESNRALACGAQAI
jgi:hypothetical protein